MKKTLIALASIVVTGSAVATGSVGGSQATISSNSVSATFATAGNGGSSVSKASNFTMGYGGAVSSVAKGALSVVVPDCKVPTTATVLGTITTVKGGVTTLGGSTASNVSTGNASGAAYSYGVTEATVAKSVQGVGGAAATTTETWAGASKNTSNSSFASQSASFVAKGGTGIVTVTQPGKHFPNVVAVGLGAVTSGVSKVETSHQVLSATKGCGSSCPQNVGQMFNGTENSWNTATGSNTGGTATTLSNVGVTNINNQ
jgi:hypothetical protein